MIHSAGLGTDYWSYALLHETYVKNSLPHQALDNKTPYEAYTTKKPNLSPIIVFGCQVYVKDSQARKDKLDGDVNHGISLGNTATSKIIHYRDHKSKTCKNGIHVSFDEAHITLARELVPTSAVALQNIGYNNEQSRRKRIGFLHV